jgi:hypothetical protein
MQLEEKQESVELESIESVFSGFLRLNFNLSNGMKSDIPCDKKIESTLFPPMCSRVDICYSDARAGKPLTGLVFYDEHNKVLLKIGKDGFNVKSVTLAADEKVVGFRSAGPYDNCQASHLHF